MGWCLAFCLLLWDLLDSVNSNFFKNCFGGTEEYVEEIYHDIALMGPMYTHASDVVAWYSSDYDKGF